MMVCASLEAGPAGGVAQRGRLDPQDPLLLMSCRGRHKKAGKCEHSRTLNPKVNDRNANREA